MGSQKHSGIKIMFFFQTKLSVINFFNTDTILKDFHLHGETVPQKGNKKVLFQAV